jgi:CHASE1-domain containing sensor protein
LRDEYFPVHALSQADGNTAILGLDLGSEPERRRTLEKARDTGQAAATQLVRLAQNAKGQAGILLFVPVFRPGQPTATTEDRRAALEGFAVGVFRSVDMFEAILERETMPGGYDHFVFDGPSLIVHHRARAKALEEPDDSLVNVALARRVERSLRFADREWNIVTVLSPPPNLGMDSALYAILGAGLIGTILAGYYVRSSQRRTQQLTELAAGLKATAEALKLEVDKGRQLEISLRAKATRLERFQGITAGREQRMVRLKEEVNTLLREQKQPEKYVSHAAVSPSAAVAAEFG